VEHVRPRFVVLAAAVFAIAVSLGVALALSSGGSRANGSLVGARAHSSSPSARASSASARGSSEATQAPKLPAAATVVTVGTTAISRAIPAGFVGLSLEYSAVPAYAGTDPAALDPAFVQLIRNLAPGQSPVLRIGGDSTDRTWWPVAGISRPAGVNYTLTPDWLKVVHALATSLQARMILGVNLEADSGAVASAEARALSGAVGAGLLDGIELGNEPELYGIFTWDGSRVKGRPPGYDFSDFNRDFSRIGATLKGLPLAGPAVGAPEWFRYLGQFLAGEPRVRVVTLHRYPLQLCYVHPDEPNFPMIGNLLSARASRTLADSVARQVALSHARGVPVRIDEMNTISCGDSPGVAKSFASALWALDASFQMARVGVDGINMHSYPGATYELFTFSRAHGGWRAFVEPAYYGLLLFAQAAPPGSRLLGVSGGRALESWATRAPDGTTRVVVINDGARARTVALRVPALAGTATLERLQARSLTAQSGVTLDGQSFGSTTATGLLAGVPRTLSVVPAGHDYVFVVPAASAAFLTLKG
jgi:hypothetical protein